VDPRIQLILKVMAERGPLICLSSTEAAKLLGLSVVHLRRLFHRQVGVTFSVYVRQIRLTKSAALLADHQRPIKQIARECGYVDLSNFYRDFRGYFGTTPKSARLKSLASNLSTNSSRGTGAGPSSAPTLPS
jgi:AraC-like DNA-binding protein